MWSPGALLLSSMPMLAGVPGSPAVTGMQSEMVSHADSYDAAPQLLQVPQGTFSIYFFRENEAGGKV